MVRRLRENMDKEYRITSGSLGKAKLSAALGRLPSPILRPQIVEIYNFRVEEDGYYFVDRDVHAATAGHAFKQFIDAAFSAGAERVEVTRLKS